MSASSSPAAPDAARRRTGPPPPLSGFVPVFAWGVQQVFTGRKFLVVLILALGAGALFGFLAVPQGPFVSEDQQLFKLWLLFDVHAIGTFIPLVALIFVTTGFAREIRRRTLVYHLVRPVSRTTMYLARFASGVVPAVLVTTLLLYAMCIASRVDVPTPLWGLVPLFAAAGVLAYGALYYLLATLFRRGIIAGLIYTFVIEGVVATARGATQHVSFTYHLRSLVQGTLNDVFLPLSPALEEHLSPDADNLDPQGRMLKMLTSMGEVVYETPTVALVVLGCITVVLLAVGIVCVKRSDYALKD